MQQFHVIEDGGVILRSKGLFRQSKLYRRGGDIYAGFGAGFIKLAMGGGTSLPNVSWLDVEGPEVVVADGKRPKFAGAVEG